MANDERRHPTSRVECDLSRETKEFLTSLSRPPIGETSIEQKLNSIIEMLMALGSLPSRLEMMETRLETMHGLLRDLSTDPEKLQQLTEQLKSSTDELDATVKANQPKQS